MADIQTFRGLRYDLSRVGSLSDVIAPPYDVIDEAYQSQLYTRHDHNVVRLILNRGDDLSGDQTVYDAAAKDFKTWRRDGILISDMPAAIYVYHQTFTYEGTTYTRRGFMSRIRLEPFGEGKIFPHEETHSHAKEDRFNLMSACRANMSQIFGIYPDETNEAQDILEAAISDKTPLTATDDLGVEHKMWLVSDTVAIANAAAVMGPKPIYIADGHHRYETACNIQTAMREKEDLPADHPCDYVLMMCVSMHDPGMAVLPTHRLIRGVPEMTSAELTAKLEPFFDVETAGKGAVLAGEIWEAIAVEELQSTLGFYCRADDAWLLVRMKESGEDKLEELAGDQSADWRSLGVAILHKLVLEHILDGESLPTPKYVRKIEDVVHGLQNGDTSGRDLTGQQGTGEPFQLACLVMPATVDHVRSISESGERMPAKSTYFYPKLVCGLVINPLD